MVVNIITSIISSTQEWVPAGAINGLFSSLRSMVIEFIIKLSNTKIIGVAKSALSFSVFLKTSILYRREIVGINVSAYTGLR